MAPLDVTAADVMSRAVDLVDECRWRFDLVRVAFHEKLGHRGVPFLEHLHVLGADDDGTMFWYSTRDLWVADILVPARVDAGGILIESRDIDHLTAQASLRMPEQDLYPVLNGMARQLI